MNVVKTVTVVEDLKINSRIGLPMFHATVTDARRSFEVACRDSNSLFNHFPHDYRLLHIANYSEASSKFDILEEPVVLCSASEFIKNESI